MRNYLIVLLCSLLSNVCHAWELVEVEDLSVGYRQYLGQAPVPGTVNYNTPGISFALPNNNNVVLPPDTISFPLPQVQYLCDTNVNLKVDFLNWLYYRTNMDMMLMNVQFITLNQDIPLITFTNAVGASYKGFTLEYAIADRLINNVYLNALFPSNNSILFQYQILGKDKDK